MPSPLPYIDTQKLQLRYRWVQRVLFSLLLLVSSGYFVWMAHVSDGVIEHGDGIAHYQAARYAPQQPELYLDHWSKPLFTLLASPFAQFGFPGMIVFNVSLYIFTACVVFVWAEKKNSYWAWLTPLLLLFSVVYFDMVNAGMTEILFAAILTACVYLFLQKQYIAGALLFSFSIFSRPEGNLILPLFLVFLLWEKQWKAIPFLATGFTIYSIVGGFVFHDFLWYFHKNPYASGPSVYGSGEWNFFLKHSEIIWGYLPLAGFLGGTAVLLGSLLGKNRREAMSQLLLIVLPVAVVFGVHSYVWWKGIQGSAGLLRVMATVVPLSLFAGILFLEWVQHMGEKIMAPRYVLLLLALASIPAAWYLYSRNLRRTLLPIHETEYQKVLSEAGTWFKNEAISGKVYYQDPYFVYKANLNPFDPKRVAALYSLPATDPLAALQPGEYLVWDALLSPVEGHVSKPMVLDEKRLEILHVFKPEKELMVYHGIPYEIIVARVR